jgi:Transposase DNA-binding/Transposase Tn5 dimerisation domain
MIDVPLTAEEAAMQHQAEQELDWAVQEFGAAQLGAARRTARLVALARQVSARPQASLPEACGDPASLKAAYRFFDNDAVSDAALLASHRQATGERVAAEPLVLAVQDTTLLEWTQHPATTGLGMLASTRQQGFVVHSTLAVTPERVPLGVLAQQVWTRDPAQVGKKHQRRQRPTAEKESQKWLTSLQAVAALHQPCPTTHLVRVGDSEADVYDLFAAARPDGVDLLVRASQPRRVHEPEGELWAAVASQPVVDRVTVEVPREPGRPARTATCAVRFRTVTVRPPKAREAVGEHLEPLALWAVTVTEEPRPANPDIEPLDWRLLTTCPVLTREQALERIAWYTCRWMIEVWHKVMKSGCRLEARQLETAERLRRCLALYSVVAWRMLWATLLARAAPDLPCTALLAPEEWQALWCTIHRQRTPPVEPPTLAQAVGWIARLGGYLGRPGDGPPGATVLWRGFHHLTDLTSMYPLLRPSPLPSQDVGNG